ncbi:ribonuclease H-like domain-containing protein [Aspergillus cavernicola]|uniref:Ribonuclease H-like domain-containing protein n=1 Tax=Aspergillus cavernicola TaxID=176166 RepID=A0ABR4HN92_9EURO
MVKDFALINTLEALKSLVDWAARQDTWMGNSQPPLYINIEGEQLSQHGKISLMTVLVYPSEFLMRPNIVDIHLLGPAAFSTAGKLGKSLKDILESPQILKVFFDVRNDSDALYAHYGIQLQGVRDIQLMESARRLHTLEQRYLSGLSKYIAKTLFDKKEIDQWKLCKATGEALWNPRKGGSYIVFNARPLSDDIIKYYVGDVQYLPRLYFKYRCSTDRWSNLITEASQMRVCASQTADYQPDGPGRALSPWDAEQNQLLDEWDAPPPQTDYFSYDSDR